VKKKPQARKKRTLKKDARRHSPSEVQEALAVHPSAPWVKKKGKLTPKKMTLGIGKKEEGKRRTE